MAKAFRRSGFSLVEVLVTLAITAILVALLLPSVLAARESARRVACASNLRQVAHAIAAHANAVETFPPGGVRCPTARFYGHSWWVFILPYLEQQDIYDRFDKTGRASGTQYHSTGWILLGDGTANLHNRALLDGFVLPSAQCPSSPLPLMDDDGGVGVSYAKYVGISGSVDHPTARTVLSSHGGGTFSFGGILVAETAIRPKAVTDGVSKTIMVGEQSDYLRLPNGTRKSCLGASLLTMSLSSYFPGDPRLWNLTTIKHPVSKDATLQYGCHDGGPVASNTPLQSAHIGIAHVAFADGSVRPLSEGTDVAVLKRLADRDDERSTGQDD